MPPAATQKKERGCFQCSRRRIVCDRTEPSCLKCAKKGIECSGLGRIRFAEGVARRGRYKDCKIPTAGGNDAIQPLPTTTEFQALRWPGEEKAKRRKTVDVKDEPAANDSLAPSTFVAPAKLASPTLPTDTPAKVDEEDGEVEEIGRGHDAFVTTQAQTINIDPWIAPFDPRLRMLFSYCKSLNQRDLITDV